MPGPGARGGIVVSPAADEIAAVLAWRTDQPSCTLGQIGSKPVPAFLSGAGQEPPLPYGFGPG